MGLRYGFGYVFGFKGGVVVCAWVGARCGGSA